MKVKNLRKFKILGLTILSCILCFSMAIACMNLVKPASADGQAPVLSTFEMNKNGASVKLDDPTGIRFAASISSADYQALVTAYGEDGFEFGMAIARVGTVEELKALDGELTMFKMTCWDTDENPTEQTDVYKYIFAIHTISETNYNATYTALGYVKTEDGVIWANYTENKENTRTPFQVATTAMVNDYESEYLNNIVDVVMNGKTLTVENLNLTAGQSSTAVVTVDGVKIDAFYSVTDSNVAKVENGKIVAVGAGQTQFTATVYGKDGASYSQTATLTVTKGDVTPVLENGMLNLNTNGEETTVKVYASSDTELATALKEQTVTATTFDIRDFVISYMEENSIKTYGAYEYKVTVESASYKGVYTTEKFVPINNETVGAGYGTQFGYAAAGTYASAKAEGHYFFLTEDVDVSASAKINNGGWVQTNIALFNEMSIDGRGNSIVMTYTHTEPSNDYTGLFGYLGGRADNTKPGASWKNVHVQVNLTVEEGSFAYSAFVLEAYNLALDNCYIEINLLNKTEDSVFMGAIGWGSKFNNCIIELNNHKDSVGGLTFNRNSALGNQNIINTVIIDGENEEVVSGDKTSLYVHNAYGYDSLEDFMQGVNGKVMNSVSTGFNTEDFTGKCYEDWSAWEVTETDIKLLGNTVRTTLQTEVTPVLTGDMLALNTKGQVTTVSVYASTDTEYANVLTSDVTYATTYDIRELILSYMEEKVATTGKYTYNVLVESKGYKGVYTSETFVPITQASEFYTCAPAGWSGFTAPVRTEYYFLTADIDISAYANKNTTHGDSMWAAAEFNLDGRGHTITNTYSHTKTSAYRGIACYMGSSEQNAGSATVVRNWWKNLSYVANITASDSTYRVCNIIANNIVNYDFYNCYFEVSINNNYTGNTKHAGLFDVYQTNFYDCMFVLNNVDTDAKDLLLVTGADFSITGTCTLNNCAIINNDTARPDVVTKDCTRDFVVHTAHRYNSIADFIAGNNGTLRNDDKPAENGAVANGTKCYTGWDSVWSITDTAITLCGKTVKTIA